MISMIDLTCECTNILTTHVPVGKCKYEKKILLTEQDCVYLYLSLSFIENEILFIALAVDLAGNTKLE